MNKRILVNGVLYEAVSPRSNRNRRFRSMNESYGQKVSSRELYYGADLSVTTTPYGPNIAWYKGHEIDVVLAGDDDKSPVLIVQQNPNGDTVDWADGVHYFQREYDNSQDGYDEAVNDFQDVCRAIDRGDSTSKVARRFHLDDLGVM